MYYAYYLVKSKKSGITNSWDECKEIVNGYESKYKKFKTLDEAKYWLNNDFKTKNYLIEDAIYFDAGTGRGMGVEVRLTDSNKESLLKYIMPQNLINPYGNYFLSKKRSNNFGELTGLYLALKYAIKFNITTICGDSELVIKYWVNMQYNKENLDTDTIDLIHKTNELYKIFKNNNGNLIKISGDINPADLGFHK